MSTSSSNRALSLLVILVVGGVAIYVAWSLRAQIEPQAVPVSPGSVAMIEAAAASSPDTLRALLKGGDPNARNSVSGPEQGMTPLMYAARAGRLNNVKALIDAKANVGAQATDGRTALMYAAMSEDAAITAALLDAGAGVDARDEQAVTALMLAAARGDVLSLDLILRRGANPDSRNKWGDTALLYAARTGNIDKIRLLLNAVQGVDTLNQAGQSALWLIFENETVQPDLVALLLGRGAKVNQADAMNRVTPLMRAAQSGNVECVKLLLAAGADPALKDAEGLTAREWAANRGDDRGRAVVPLVEIPHK